ncbi:MAG: helix-turn-helix domain-containing protein [Flavobacteriaceae bacterium]|nr:helix-turn-helix domain-containing protein [Flavobacteriaceae bacterium]
MQDFSIGEASRRCGVKVPTIRYYEEIGLLPLPPRNEGNRRIYDTAAINRLAFVRHARALGFEIAAIRTLLELQGKPGQPCDAADAIARIRLTDVEQRIDALGALRIELKRMISECTLGNVSECRVIEILTDHNRHSISHG